MFEENPSRFSGDNLGVGGVGHPYDPWERRIGRVNVYAGQEVETQERPTVQTWESQMGFLARV